MTDAAQNIVIIIYAALLMGLIVLAIAMHLLISKQRARAYKLQLDQANQKLEHEMTKIRFDIQEEELTKVSGEIHDNIGQVLSSVGLTLEAVNTKLLSERDQTILKQSVKRVNRVTDELRGMAHRLNGPGIEKNGLIEALQTEVDYLQLSGTIGVAFSNRSGVYKLAIAGTKSLLLFRMAQEAIANIIRHAEATTILIELFVLDSQILQLDIIDNGKGFNPDKETSGQGLMTMKKRAVLLGANLQIHNNNAGGSTISIQINL